MSRIAVVELPNPNPLLPEEEIAFNLMFAKQIYRDTKQFSAMVMGLSKEKRFIVQFACKSPEEKNELAVSIKEYFKSVDVEAIIFMTEGWSVQLRHPALFNPEIRPSLHPDRVEVFSLSYLDKNINKAFVFPIVREDEQVYFEAKLVKDADVKTVDRLWGDYFK